MPNYKPLTIGAEVAILDARLESIKGADGQLESKPLDEKARFVLVRKRSQLAVQIGEAVDKVLAACDVAEQNNRIFCHYMEETHSKAKSEMATIENLLPQIEKAVDAEKVKALNSAAEKVVDWRDDLKKDDEQLRALGMVEQYRGNLWTESVRQALPYVKDRAGAFALRLNNRKKGMVISTEAVGRKNRVDEYVTRAGAMRKTARMRVEQHLGEAKDFEKIEKQAISFANSVKLEVDRLGDELHGTQQSLNNYLKTIEKVKAPTKETYVPILLFEPKLDRFLKDCNGRVKTMQIQLRENVKKLLGGGEKAQSIKPHYEHAAEALGDLKVELEEFDESVLKARKQIEKGKKFK
ncbi:MAG TPA: hypothetical protein VME43_07125 [Bryobacteraceae bacterium]|nr:hypothetical protein [Bryobacteraceae bacterium]